MEKKKIVVLGAGYGGVLTAKKLAKKYKRDKNVSVSLIDKHGYHTMMTELHEVAAARTPESSIRIDLDKVFYGRNVDLVLDEVTDIDFDKKTLTGTVGNYDYDYLVLGTGSKPTFYGCKGAPENALTLWSYDDAVKVKYHVLDMFQKASISKSQKERKELLTFAVIGCGFTGIEMIGELAEWSDELCETFNIDRKEVRLCVLDMLPRVLPNFKDKMIEKTEARLKKMGVEIMTESSIMEVSENAVYVKDKDPVYARTTIWAAGIESSEILSKIPDEDLKQGPRSRVQTDQYLRSVNHEDVFVVGDNIFYIPEGEERPVPQMVENAEHSSALVANNIYATIEKKELKPYKPSFHGAMVCIGGRYGVAQVGMGDMQFVFSGFIAMFIKHFINVIYFLQVLGFHKIWTYMMHEFFHVPNGRSFLGAHFSKRSPNFWKVPLRLFVGVMWLLEGLAKLSSVINNPSDIFLIPAKVASTSGASEATVSAAEAATAAVSTAADAASTAAQAVSGASEAVSSAATSAADMASTAAQAASTAADAVTGASESVSSAATSVAHAASAGFIDQLSTWADGISTYSGAIPVPGFVQSIVDWSMNLIFYTPDGGYTVMATIFQTGMVCAEILVGLALIAGLFTAPAAIVSILMGLMIWSSSMAGIDMIWYMTAACALIGGSGSTLGLDYYVLPRLKKLWMKIPLVKKWYLFS